MALLLEEIIKSVEAFLKLKNRNQKPYVDPNLDPVLLVPGIAGSILNAVDHENGKEERVWVRIFGADHEFRTKMWSRFDPSTGKKCLPFFSHQHLSSRVRVYGFLLIWVFDYGREF